MLHSPTKLVGREAHTTATRAKEESRESQDQLPSHSPVVDEEEYVPSDYEREGEYEPEEEYEEHFGTIIFILLHTRCIRMSLKK